MGCLVILSKRPIPFPLHMSHRIRWLGHIKITDRRTNQRPLPVLRKQWTPLMETDGYFALRRGSSCVWRFDLLQQPSNEEHTELSNQLFEDLKQTWNRRNMYWIHIALTWKHKQASVHCTICFKNNWTWEQVLDWTLDQPVDFHRLDWRRVWGNPVYSLYKLRYPNGSKFIKQWSKGTIDTGRSSNATGN